MRTNWIVMYAASHAACTCRRHRYCTVICTARCWIVDLHTATIGSYSSCYHLDIRSWYRLRNYPLSSHRYCLPIRAVCKGWCSYISYCYCRRTSRSISTRIGHYKCNYGNSQIKYLGGRNSRTCNRWYCRSSACAP